MRQELELILVAARTLPSEELPRLLGDLEEVRATALARLSAPIPAHHPPDQLLGVEEAASRLGISRGYLYHNHHRLPLGTRRIGRALRFSAREIDKYIQRGNTCRARRSVGTMALPP